MRDNWVDGFVKLTEGVTSPLLFRKWGAISAIAGALERKVWVRTAGSNLYPSTYIVLVAPAGIGKSEVTSRISDFWRELEDVYLAPSSASKASLMDELANASRRIILKPGQYKTGEDALYTYHALLICANELGVLLPSYDAEFMATLTDLWDCKGYSEKKRTRGTEIKIDRTFLNMLAATTPHHLKSTLPEGAWEQGFLSRTILVYSGERKIQSLFLEEQDDSDLKKQLTADLKTISNLYGKITWTAEAASLIDQFHMTGGEPRPHHPKLGGYTVRRTVHLIKLCMIASVATSSEMVIRAEDFQLALEWLFEMELGLEDMFKSMSQGGQGSVYEETWHFISRAYAKENNRPVVKHRVLRFLQEIVPVHAIEQTLKTMVDSGYLETRLTKDGEGYVPKPKRVPE